MTQTSTLTRKGDRVHRQRGMTSTQPLTTPVAIMAFNRPQAVAQVLAAVAQAKPTRLLLVTDGPRADHPQDARAVSEVRAVMENAVTWPCEVRTNHAPANLGCKKRMVSGIDWAFQQAEEVIFLEDDCVPSVSFFRYCQELLEHHRANPAIMGIMGTNLTAHRAWRRPWCSYSYSTFPLIWGWASWRRAWLHYDADMSTWTGDENCAPLRALFPDVQDRRFWARKFESVARQGLDTWDFQWTWTCFSRAGLSCIPRENLVTNIGFDSQATHTRDPDSIGSRLARAELSFPLVHPASVERDVAGDLRLQHTVFRRTLPVRLRSRLARFIKGMGRS